MAAFLKVKATRMRCGVWLRTMMSAACLVSVSSRITAQPNQPVDMKRPGVEKRWLETTKEAERAIEAGEWKKARKTTDAVLSEMCARIQGGEGVADLLALVTFFRALSEAGLGHEEAASWDYLTAQTLAPDLSKTDLDRYGAAGELLKPWRASTEQEQPEDSSEEEMEEGEVTPPEKIKGPAPKYPYGKLSACLDGPIEVQMVIDKEGVPRFPKLMTTQEPLLGYAALQAFRDWRFKPARFKGEPVEVLYKMTVNFKMPSCRNVFAIAKEGKDGGP